MDNPVTFKFLWLSIGNLEKDLRKIDVGSWIVEILPVKQISQNLET